MLNGLDLFSGIGGLSIALNEWVKPIAYCEIEPFCQGVLLSRMATGDVTPAPIWDDIKTLRSPTTEILRGHVDIIFGGFPCQDISVNGDKLDNRIENLELWTRDHPTGSRVEDKIAWCIEFLKQYPQQAKEAFKILMGLK